jgi:hypothetical protein
VRYDELSRRGALAIAVGYILLFCFDHVRFLDESQDPLAG